MNPKLIFSILVTASFLMTILVTASATTMFAKFEHSPGSIWTVVEESAQTPVEMPPVSYEKPNTWAEVLTEGIQTSVPYASQQAAMRTVLIDTENRDPNCQRYSQEYLEEHGVPGVGVAFPQHRVICINPDLWGDDARSLYLLAHELSHIALGEFGAASGSPDFYHRDEHFELTLRVFNRLLDMQGVSDNKAQRLRMGIELSRGWCQQSSSC